MGLTSNWESLDTMFNNHLMKACLAAVFAFGLAACSSSDDSAQTTPTEPTTPTTPTEPPAPADLTALFAAAQDASDAAGQAVEDAEAAAESAAESRKMLLTTEVGGESSTAMMNAQAILDAADDAAQAVMDAEAALAAAEKAQMDAMAIADDHPQKAALTAAVDEAVEDAEGAVEDATAVRDGTTIKNAVARVEGANKKGTPRSIANTVGMDIAGALASGSARTGTRIVDPHATAVPAGIVDEHKVEMDDAQGETWAEIAGEANVMMKRLGSFADTGAFTVGNGVVSVASVAGMTAADVFGTETVPTDVTTDGTSLTSSTAGDAEAINYMGIPGALFCLGGDDGCSVTAGKLGAGWYFSPAFAMYYYQNQTDDTATDEDESLMYEREVLYAEYGHWLAVNTSDNTQWDVGTFSNFVGTSANLDVDTVGNNDNGLANSATYTGSAAGMSSRTMGSGDSATTDSGRFTADVTLEATFGASPMLEGTINRFQGDAVGAGWSVKLHSSAIDTTAFTATAAATGGGLSGVWSATMTGINAAAGRPTGAHGGFVAHFADGDAAGAFATRIAAE